MSSGIQEEYGCNCRVKSECPMDGKCQTPAVVYQATVSAEGSEKKYVGLTEPPFKKRYYSHKASFNKKPDIDSGTALAHHIWNLKDRGVAFDVKWEILDRSSPYKCGSRVCHLCITEKWRILMADPEIALNKRSELVAKCRHARKFKLATGVT